ncbi:hypothetical protein LSAT2_032589 [Lamellibrachia satsuma]|nr:hypothetical protein LSAT2_032589 [Lamellibrachia satsuma]
MFIGVVNISPKWLFRTASEQKFYTRYLSIAVAVKYQQLQPYRKEHHIIWNMYNVGSRFGIVAVILVSLGCREAFLLDDDDGCNGKYFDKETEFCCNDMVYAKDSTHACCGGRFVYDPNEYFCEVYGTSILLSRLYIEKKGCNGKYFDKETEFCCGDKVNAKDSTHSCCGGKIVYDPNKYYCDVSGVTVRVSRM